MTSQHPSAIGFRVIIGGTTFEQVNPSGLRSIMVEDHVDMASLCTVIVGRSETDPALTFKIGDAVEAYLMMSDEALFKGELISIDHSFQVQGTSTMTLRAIDNVHRLGRGRKTRFWNDMTDADIAKEVGGESGLSVQADPTEETHPYVMQRNESNIAFLKRIAARNNFQVRVEKDSLLFKKASFGGQAIPLKMGEDLVSLNCSFNSSNQVQKVIVQGWSPKDKKEIVGQSAIGEVTKIGGGSLGGEDAGVFGDSVAYITDIPVTTQEMADRVAKAEMERLARQYCRGKCVVRGNSTIRAGTSIEVSGFSEGLNGAYYVIASRHLINAKTGYSTEVSFCSNTHGA